MTANFNRLVFVLGLMVAALETPLAAQHTTTVGLDHIPVVVAELGRSITAYGALGFTLKAGRPHTNGIQNAHVKFQDGAGIELVAAPMATDALAAYYVDLLKSGEGPAFLTLHARDTKRLHAALREGGYEFQQRGQITTLSARELDWLFIVRDNRSPTDRPEHFTHANGATALGAVWVATKHGDVLAHLLAQLGGRQQRRQVLAPDSVEATVVTLGEGEIVILTEQHQLIPGRPVVGVSFRVSDLRKVRRVLAQARIEPRTRTETNERILVEPSIAHGLWLEFRGRS